MSIQAITLALALREVTPSEKLLLIAMANYADENGRCWPSQVRLSEDTCLSERTIRTLLAELEGRGLLTRVPRRRPDGSRSTDVITLHLASDQPATTAGGCADNRQSASDQPATTAGLTTFDPSVNLTAADAGAMDDWPAGNSSAHAELLGRECPSADMHKQPALVTTLGEVARWRLAGYSWELDVVPAVRGLGMRLSGRPPTTWRYFAGAIHENHVNRTRPPDPERPTDYGPATDHQAAKRIARDAQHQRSFAIAAQVARNRQRERSG